MNVALEGRIEPEAAALMAVDIGVHTMRAGYVGPGTVQLNRQRTQTCEERWSIARLERIVSEVVDSVTEAGLAPAQLVVAAPGLVDPVHGVVQHSPGLDWHDVAVAHELQAVAGCPVLVRERVRAGAAVEGVLGVAGECPAALFVSIDDDLGAALVQNGQVSPDRAKVGDIGAIRLRSGMVAGRRLDAVVGNRKIGARYADRVGADPASSTAAQVLAARASGDQIAAEVWDETVAAIADALDWLITLFTPEMIVLGGEVGWGEPSLPGALSAELADRFEGRTPPPVRRATFGAEAAWLGAVLAGWRRARWPLHVLGSVAHRVVVDASEPHDVD